MTREHGVCVVPLVGVSAFANTRVRDDRRWMMTERHRISHGSQFTRTLSRGVRVSTRDLVVHVSIPDAVWPDPAGRRTDVATMGGPWLGLIVAKSVGCAVVRHRVARRLRAAFAAAMSSCPPEASVVVRARPSTATVGSTALAAQLTEVFSRRRVVATSPVAEMTAGAPT